jgi:hypothetical protein
MHRLLRANIMYAGKHIGIFMRTTVDLPDELMKRVKIAAVRRGTTLRDLIADALRHALVDRARPARPRMVEPPVKLARGRTIPVRSNRDIAQVFDQEDIAKLNDLYRGR